MKLDKMITRKNIINGLFITLVLAIIFIPSAKALMIQGLMEVGLFQPEIMKKTSTVNADLSAIQFKDASGKIINLEELKGKIIFLNFWATWCPPCLAEMPSIHKFYQQFKNDKDLVFLFIDADGDFPKAQAFMEKKKYDFPIYTFAGKLPENIFNRALPTTLVFDKQGRISFKAEGAANYSNKKFIAFINELKALRD